MAGFVGVVRLERTTAWSQTRNANQLRYTPLKKELTNLKFTTGGLNP
jgi:hypothetical protein